jgi:hypothetical protein
VTIDRLRTLLDVWGAATDRWPADERAAALALIARSPEARALRDEAARLDALLDADAVDGPSPALVERVLASAPSGPRAPRTRDRPLRWLVPLAMAAGLAALWLGRTALPPPETLPIAALGIYEVGSDEVLSTSDLALAGDDAWSGCPDDELDCPIETVPSDAHSNAAGRIYS